VARRWQYSAPMRRLMCAVLMLGCVARLASADDRAPKSETTAEVLSLSAGLLLPAGLSLAAYSQDTSTGRLMLEGALVTTVVGPTLGHWYSGRYWTTATTVRVVGAAALIGGLVPLSSDCNGSCTAIGGGLVATGLIALVGGAFYDVATSSRSAREYNARQFTVAPVALPAAGGGTAIGFGVAGTF